MVTEPPSHEAALLIRVAQRDQAALSELYDRYARVLYAVAFKSLRSAEESEEVVLDVFAQVWRTADRYDVGKARVDTWLFMMTRSRVLDRLRTLQRVTKVTVASENFAEIQTPTPGVDPLENVLISERRDRVLAALSQLPEAQRQVIELAYYKGLTQSEIAAQTNLSLGTVKTRIRLGLSKLRVVLGNWEPS
ncbi:sigma-70 family RNA polymerase sigma factor [Leptolyngbya sp. FACHB-321]|uniref:sigma-70 family RNA polymerase sigma factor n=1 Tax=Leptolyngbya sp. FACHB-321 TaxID=2692807 RepID=UPI001689D4F2|nr:sigma-70 family RNA polymerase sigma factor [Leptolyngbya sp. FACHB-321]MBD2038065.1 sigma-70 family RNA polymerase sigma factor [Leptolyngbya sp. FACHB-321]